MDDVSWLLVAYSSVAADSVEVCGRKPGSKASRRPIDDVLTSIGARGSGGVPATEQQRSQAELVVAH